MSFLLRMWIIFLEQFHWFPRCLCPFKVVLGKVFHNLKESFVMLEGSIRILWPHHSLVFHDFGPRERLLMGFLEPSETAILINTYKWTLPGFTWAAPPAVSFKQQGRFTFSLYFGQHWGNLQWRVNQKEIMVNLEHSIGEAPSVTGGSQRQVTAG